MESVCFEVSDTNLLFPTLEVWLETCASKGVTARTLKTYRTQVEPFLLFLHQQGCRCLEDVQPQHIRRWLLHWREQGVSAETLWDYYRNPRTFWNWCIREGLTEHNPFAKVEPPKREKVLKPALTPEQVEALLKACEGREWLRLRDRALILLLLDTGLRIHECYQLRVMDVVQNALIVRGKGGKQRVVVLSAEVRLALQRYLKACPYRPTAEQPLWWGTDGALTLHGIKLAVRKVGKRAGVKVGAHQLRRTFATWSLRNGIDLEHLRLLMGHSDLKTTQQYLALVEDDLKRAHEQYSPLKMLKTQHTRR